MEKEKIITRVHDYYWNRDLNCATTMLKILAENYNIKLNRQIIDAAIGMHGAGKYRAQCGLVEGMLMFTGIYGKVKNYSECDIVDACFNLAQKFEKQFGSLLCKDLRPEGFKDDNPPHLCENLTVEAVNFAMTFMDKF